MKVRFPIPSITTAVLFIISISSSVRADIFVGPGAVAGPVIVNVENTIIVGSTTVTSAAANNGANVTGFNLLLNSLLGMSPGSILIQTLNGNALNANGGSISTLNSVLLRTQGGHGVLANTGASSVILNGTNIQTTGTGAGLVAIGGTINATGVVINNLGNSTPTVSAGHGAIAESGGIITLNAGNSIATGAFNAVGLGASGSGSQINANALVPIVMNGRGALAIYLHDGGQVQLMNNSVLQLNASNSVGVSADNTAIALGALGSNLTINFNATPAAGQAGGTGIVAFNGGSVALQTVTVQGVGAGAGAWARLGSSITLTGNSLININSNANPTYYTLATAYLATQSGQVGSIFGVTSGLPIGGLLSNAGTINSTGTRINVSSNNGVGAYAAFNTATSFVNMVNNVINTTGVSSFGIEAAANGRITGVNTDVTSSGGGAALFVTAFDVGYGSINLTNSNVEALGANTVGLASTNFSNSLTTLAQLTGSFLTSEEDSVIYAAGGPVLVTVNDSTLTAQNGLLVEAVNNAFAPQQTAIQLNASNDSHLTGNAQADAQSIINMNLARSTWSGAAFDVTNVTLDPLSLWRMTASSTVTQQVTNSGFIYYTPPSGSFKTLTTGSYLGANGAIGLNTYLGSDGSPSDKLIINGGTASGNTSLFIFNAGGPGALTFGNGILVVDTINGGTTTTNAFNLGNPVLAGPFEYRLYRSSVDGTNPQAWYLRSICSPSSPGCSEPDPNPRPGNPEYRSEIGLYPVLPAMTLLYGQTLLDTLHQRVGQGKWPGDDTHFNDSSKRVWSRIIGLHGDRNRINSTRRFRSSEYDYNFVTAQFGGDLFERENDNGRRDQLGVYGAFGRGTGDVTRPNSFYLGSNEFDAYTAGAYWTIHSAQEAYVDTVFQATSYDASSKSYRLDPVETNGWGFAGSIEAGYPLIFNQWMIEPQAQAIYQTIDLDTSEDVAAVIRFDNTDSTIGRVGVRIAHQWSLDNTKTGKVLTAWFRPNIWHEFKGTPQALFSSAYGFIPFRSELEGTTLELNLGATLQTVNNVAFYVNGSYGQGLDIHADSYDGRVGVKVMLG